MNSQKTTVAVIILAIIGSLAFHFAGSQFPPVVGFLVGVVTTVFAVVLTNNCSANHHSSNSHSSDNQAEGQALYVGNLPYKANEGKVRELFSQYGTVYNVRLMKDKRTGKRRGFGFVTVAPQDANKIIKKLNDFDFMERSIKVRIANDPKHPEEETNERY